MINHIFYSCLYSKWVMQKCLVVVGWLVRMYNPQPNFVCLAGAPLYHVDMPILVSLEVEE